MDSIDSTVVSSPLTNQVDSSGITFGPTVNQKHYISLFRHRGQGNTGHKSQWHKDIVPKEEYDIFEKADITNSICNNGHYWGFGDKGGKIIGARQERLAKFPRTQNQHDPWHGYPVTKDSNRPNNDLPSDELVRKWIKNSLIDRHFGLKILRGVV